MSYCAYFLPDGNSHYSYCARADLATAQADCDRRLKAKQIEGTCACTSDAADIGERCR